MKLISRLAQLEERAHMIQTDLSNPETAKDSAKYQKLAKEFSDLQPLVTLYGEYKRNAKELEDINRTMADQTDPAMRSLYEEEQRELQNKSQLLIEKIEDEILKGSDPSASRNILVEVRAGTGGEEAALFAADLYRMYSRFAANHNLRTEVIDSSPTGKGGFKEIVFGISGSGAYAYFKFESGIHRVQRVPDTEANGRVHTSAVTVAVLPEAEEEEVQISPGDLKIDVYRASGAGGQHVNKTESAVRITHLPSGLVVQCQDERSQHKNKEKAMRVLRARLYDAMQAKQHQEQAKQRKEQVGSGDRSGKIRTYNFPDQRVTDHRIGLTLHALSDILDGSLDGLVRALEQDERERKLTDAA